MVQRNARFERSGNSAAMYDQVKDRVEDVTHRSQEMVQEHPASMALLAFGVGFGIGLLLVTSMAAAEERRTSWYEKYLPDMANLPNMARVPSKRQMSRQLSRYLPEALTRHLN